MRRFCLALLPTLCLACAHQQVDSYYGSRSSLAPLASASPATTSAADPASTPDHISEVCRQARVHFDRDDTVLHPDDYPVLQQLAQCLRDDRAQTLRIDGNADERGTTDYNLALGDRRARSVAGYLELLGVPRGQLATVSYGKEKPLCGEHDETCWRENRRAGLNLGH